MNCQANGIFSNFAFEVQMTIIQGDCGGVVIRNDGKGHFYYFHICQNGTSRVTKYVSSSGSDAQRLADGNSPTIRTGLGQQNKIAVLAIGSTLRFYVNGQQIDQEQDSSYTTGRLGLIAYPAFKNATDVCYNDAKLWTPL